MSNTEISFTLNSKTTTASCRPDTTVLQYLRTHMRMTGTKEGCAEGDCGACTILISQQDEKGYMAANSCITVMGQIAGSSVVTVEGLSLDETHPIQKTMAANGSSQCGFCTPGIVISLAGLLNTVQSPSEPEIHDALAGNLCRCTGYKPIVEAAKTTKPHCLPKSASLPKPPLIHNNDCSFYAPKSLAELFEVRAHAPGAMLLGGGTDLGVALAEHATKWPVTLWTGAVKELLSINETASHWEFGSAVTWSNMVEHMGDALPSLTVLLRRFGSAQIRNMGTIGGNIATASPIGDGPPPLIALGATITLASAHTERTIALEDFFLDYRKTALNSDEIIKTILVPKPVPNQYFRVWKVSKRYDQDISAVCGAFNLRVEGDEIVSARIAFGGMAAIPKRALSAEAACIGMSVVDGDFDVVAQAIRASYDPLSDWRATSVYRSAVAGNLALRLGAELNGQTVEVMS